MEPNYALTVLAGGESRLAKMSETDRFLMTQAASDEDAYDFVPTRITVGSSGVRSFNTADGEALAAPLVGYPIMAVKVRGYWPVKDGGSKMPFCSSVGGVNGTVSESYTDEDMAGAVGAHRPHPMILDLDNGRPLRPAYDCASCPLSDFRSAHQGGNGDGQACKQKIRLLLLPEGWSQPVILNIPTMSIKGWNQYCSSIKQKTGLPYYAFRLSIGIEKKESSTKQPYGMLTFTLLDKIDNMEVAQSVAAVQEAFGVYLKGRNVAADDYQEELNGVVEGAVA